MRVTSEGVGSEAGGASLRVVASRVPGRIRAAELTGATRPLAPAAVGAALLAGLQVRDGA